MILYTALGKRDYALLAILLQTGRRLSEVATLRYRHVQLVGKGKQRKITLTFEHCKGDKTMIDTLPASISRALLTWLSAYYGVSLASLDKDAPLWVTLSVNTTQRGQPLGIQAVQQICEKYLETHTHVTRHTFTHNMIKAGATLPEIQARLGMSRWQPPAYMPDHSPQQRTPTLTRWPECWASIDDNGVNAGQLLFVFNNMNGALPHIKCACLL